MMEPHGAGSAHVFGRADHAALASVLARTHLVIWQSISVIWQSISEASMATTDPHPQARTQDRTQDPMDALKDAAMARDWCQAAALAETLLATPDYRGDALGGDALVWRILGDTYAGLNRPNEAIEAFTQARRLLSEGDAASRVELLRAQRIMRAQVRNEKLLHDFDVERAAKGAAHELAFICLLRLIALWDLDRYDEALVAAHELTAYDDATVAYWAMRGRLVRIVRQGAERAGELAKVVAAIQRLAPDDVVARVVCDELLRPSDTADQLSPWLQARGFTGHVFDDVEVIVPPVQDVPVGSFVMGSRQEIDAHAFPDEAPDHVCALPTYAIGRYPVTVAEYACFVNAGHPAPERWLAQLAEADHPVTQVTWRDAAAYAEWLSERTGQIWRIPSEAEWEKAARWDPERQEARTYPWGNDFNSARCVSDLSPTATCLAVGSLPGNISSYGVCDMAGNVWEYTCSLFKPYPYSASDGREAGDLFDDHVARGGSYNVRPRLARAACRGHRGPIDYGEALGFRLVRAAGEHI